MARSGKLLYVYECAGCGYRGEERFDVESHDGEISTCHACGAAVMLEWDAGVTMEAAAKKLAAETIARARK
ncbi:hypothetical protein [Paraburkholderia sp. J12]|uniref:hypothetical protein n=1 Tax=Paraburkholderia sp. J12 TaxID=2805432 RepID=UPI002ABD2960|nr:hypothetical protein [Paraburkholderia sp. J12]